LQQVSEVASFAPPHFAFQAACGRVDEVLPETFTPSRGISCGQVFLKPTPGFRFPARTRVPVVRFHPFTLSVPL
jgi:hypothetical protein